MGDFWFNTRTRQVEQGHQSDWTDLLGPYETREQAERALDTARERTDQWDAQDRADRDWGYADRED